MSSNGTTEAEDTCPYTTGGLACYRSKDHEGPHYLGGALKTQLWTGNSCIICGKSFDADGTFCAHCDPNPKRKR